jgi:hypothetical protein
MWQLFKSFGPVGGAGVAIGLLGALVGTVVGIAAAPLLGSILAVMIYSVFGVALWIAFRPQRQRKRLVKKGVAAEATILSIQETGWTIQENYGIAKLRLTVEPGDGKPSYEAETRAMINRFDIPQYQPGKRVKVAIDQRDPQKVAIA